VKVVHITPTYFDDSSLIGGGERYASELALWMSRVVDTTLVSFSRQRKSYRRDNLKVEIYPVKHLIHGNPVNPLSFRYLSSILRADVVHVHHVHTLVSDMACIFASLFGKRAFVTDYGGGGSLTLNKRLPVFEGYQNAIAYSRFGLEFLPPELKRKAVLIKGGIDTERFCANGTQQREKKILYVGRILPHKGIDYLIEAFRLLARSDYTLRIVGRVNSEEYYEYLKRLSSTLNIEFVHDADDERLIREYRSALVTVLPSVHTSYNGSHTRVPELMGFTLLESQACGTPVICTDAGAMSEFVARDETGFVVESNSGEGIADALKKVIASSLNHSGDESRFGRWVEPLSWSKVVDAHLQTYAASTDAGTSTNSFRPSSEL
jgi:glycosyltransferase involved in cell wall biosynthesis